MRYWRVGMIIGGMTKYSLEELESTVRIPAEQQVTVRPGLVRDSAACEYEMAVSRMPEVEEG